jgi:hypothetical protein
MAKSTNNFQRLLDPVKAAGSRTAPSALCGRRQSVEFARASKVFPLAGAAVAEKPLGFFRTFEKARLLYNGPMVRLTSKF